MRLFCGGSGATCRFGADAWGHIQLENLKQKIWAIDASTGKAVTNFLRPPETLDTRVN
jgi:hypothetical protein